MYGLIHICLQHMVKTKFGEDVWKQILIEAGYDGKSYLTFRCYPDEETLKLIVSSAKVLCITLDDALEMLGDHFLAYVMENGYEDMLRGLGSTFLDFIQNINYLHWYLMSTAYPGVVSPSFVCSPGENEGDPPILDYYSNRMGMHPLAIGLLRAIGRDLFQMHVEFEYLDSNEEVLSPTRTLYHRRFRVIITSLVKITDSSETTEKPKFGTPKQRGKNYLPEARDVAKGKALAEKIGAAFHGQAGRDGQNKAISRGSTIRLPGKVAISGMRQWLRKENGKSVAYGNTASYRRREDKVGEDGGKRNFEVSVPATLFCKMQPYHIVFDSDNLTIVQAGTRLTQFYPQLFSSPRMDSVFELVWPLVPLTSYNLKRFKDFVFQLAAKPSGVGEEEDGGRQLFAASRRATRRRTIAGLEGAEEEGAGRPRKDPPGREESDGEGEGPTTDEGPPAAQGGKRNTTSGGRRQQQVHLPPVGHRGARTPGGGEEGKPGARGRGGGRPKEAAGEGSGATRKNGDGGGEGRGRRAEDSRGRRGKTCARGNKGSADDGKGQPVERELVLKGGIYRMEDPTDDKDSGLMIFVGTPLLHNLSELYEKSMRLSDVPLYDSTRELVLLKHQRSTEFDLMTRLEETTMELTSTWEALRIEKQKADSLLYSMMPKEVAVLLQSGERVQKSFSECTILFSDIVTFTVIASNSTPLQIIDMLNALYTEFDALTEKNDVYKVETIGDAYMVVGGVPSPSPTHAVQVAKQAVGMVQVSGRVLSPVSGLPIEIRVGMHSGPVVAGCVGLKMPRYCLFGDTVNTASRMESHGVPGKIHLSGATKRSLDGSDFKLIKRGDIEVKGKGVMDTYFLELPNEQI